MKFQDFKQITRSRSYPAVVDSRAALHAASLGLIRSVLPADKGIRLVGVTVSNFEAPEQSGAVELPLFG